MKLPSIKECARLLGGDIVAGAILCPGPDHSSGDRSLSVKLDPEAPDGFVIASFSGDDWKACKDYVRKKLGLDPFFRPNGKAKPNGKSRPLGEPVAVYPYVDQTGELLFEVLRYEPKTFRQRQPNGKGGRSWKLDGVARVIYRLPEVVEAVALGRTVFVVEGEKDADSLAKLGIPATTNAGGAGKWTSEHSAFLQGADVVVIPDNDDKGRDHVEVVAKSLQGIAKRVSVLQLPGLTEKGDVSDWIDAGHGADEFWKLAMEAPEWQPSSGEPKKEPEFADLWSDPDQSLLEDRRGDLPAFPSDALPLAWQHWLTKAAHGAGVTPDHVAVPLLAVTSGLIGGARRVRASRSWSEPMAMWTAVVGFSGSGKTPGLDVSSRSLGHIEKGRRDSVHELRRAHEQRAVSARAALKKWKAEVQEAIDKGHAPPSKPPGIEEPTPFIAPRFCVSDATTERMAVLIQARPRGILTVIDELSGLFANMSRYGGGDDRAFWLQAWGGGHHVVERVNRPPVVIDNLIVGLTGGFQPDKLEAAFRGADDGMYARILFGWPAEPDYHELADNISEIEPEFLEALMRLIDLKDDDGPRYVPLSADARAEFEQFRHFRHQQKHLLDGRDREVWAKAETHVLRLAGTLCFMAWAMYSPPDLMPDQTDRFQQMLKQAAEPAEIARQFIMAARRLWMEYFWPHARAALRQVGLTDRHRYARKVLRWIYAHNHAEISLQDVRRHALNHHLDAEQTEKVVATLVKAGWLRSKTEVTAGRPRHRWLVNPALFSC